MGDSEQEAKRRVENVWRRRLQHSEQRFHLATAQYREVQAAHGGNPAQVPEEEVELEEARERERAAEARQGTPNFYAADSPPAARRIRGENGLMPAPVTSAVRR